MNREQGRSIEAPADLAAEEALIGAAILWPDRVEAVAGGLGADAFYSRLNGLLWTAVTGLIEEGVRPDLVLVVDRARRLGADAQLSDVVKRGAAGAAPPKREHVKIILRHAAARAALATVTETRQALLDGDDPYLIAAEASRSLDGIGAGAATDIVEALTIPELCARADADAPWIIPGLLRQDWRAVIVAPEGVGKSVLLRQLAICAGQGIHPLTFQRIHPVRTLIIDAENPLASIKESGQRLDSLARTAAGDAYDKDRVRVWSRPGGLDLRDPAHRAAFVREIRNQSPDLVCAGPVYKLGGRRERESYEDAAEGILRVFDDLRTRFTFALILEHHAPKSQGGYRDLVPFGSQRWLAWPELGISLRAEKDGSGLRLGRFRGDRLHCSWPDLLVRGQAWPWEGVWTHGRDREEAL